MIRIKVHGTDRPGPEAEAQLRRVAGELHRSTGLQIDIVKGSSTRPISVALAGSAGGRPPLTVTEDWSVKGVVIGFSSAISTQDAQLLGIVVIAVIALLSEVFVVLVRRRQHELAMLRALGWSVARVGALMELEVILLASAISAAALAIVVTGRATRGAPLHLGDLLLPLVLATIAAAIAGVIPAGVAARQHPSRAMRPAPRPRVRPTPARPATLVRRALGTGYRVEHVTVVATMTAGGALLGAVVVIARQFAHALDSTVLGRYLRTESQPYHLRLALLLLAVGAIGSAALSVLGYLERRSQLATLQSLGWTRQRLATAIARRAVATTLLAVTLSWLTTRAVGNVLDAQPNVTALACRSAAAAVVAASLPALLGPIALLYRGSPGRVMRGE